MYCQLQGVLEKKNYILKNSQLLNLLLLFLLLRGGSYPAKTFVTVESYIDAILLLTIHILESKSNKTTASVI